MKKKKNRVIAALLAVLLLLGQMSPGLAEGPEELEEGLDGAETYTIMDSEIAALEVTAGFMHETIHAPNGGIYTVTLGPDEPGLSVVATPTEQAHPPVLEIFLDGNSEVFDTLTPGAPSRVIQVAAGEKRTALLRSTAQNGTGNHPVTEYTITIHRTQTRFRWSAGEQTKTETGVTVLPVSLIAPAGLEIKTLQFALGFDPAKLQLCTNEGVASTELYDFLPFVDDFHYTKRPASGYFQEQGTPYVDNGTGRLAVQFGAATTALNETAFQVEQGKERLFTLYFKVLDPDLDSSSIFIPHETGLEPVAGISVMEKIGGEHLTSQHPGMVEVSGLPHRVTLPSKTYVGGVLKVEPDKAVFAGGEILTLTAIPTPGYSFAGWDGGATGLSGDEAVLKVTVDGDMDLSSLKPRFEKRPTLPANERVDSEAPYTGDVLLTVSGAAPAAQNALADSSPFSEMDVDRNGLTVLDFHDNSGETQGAANANTPPTQTAYQVGDTATFKTRDTTVTQSTSERPAWPERTFILQAAGPGVNVWDEVGGKVGLTDAQAAELAVSFETSLNWLKGNCGPVYDRNANGRVDVLLYNIYDTYSETNGASGGYVAGLTNYAELYGNQGTRGSVGNNADVVHLDTWPAMGLNPGSPDYSAVVSTFAHEAQHLVSFSTDADWKKTQSSAAIGAANPPDWLNEGLSMAAEHALFGARSARIHTFNTSSLIRDGYSLTNWGKRLEDYALSYLFMEYLITQAGAAGQSGFFKAFYTDYSGGAEDEILKLAQRLPQFAGMSFDDMVAAFYAALYLQEDSGVYGFAGDDAFRSVRPQLAAQIPAALPPAAGVYAKLNGSTAPEGDSGLTCLGLTAPEMTLSATADRGGTVIRTPSKAVYSRGDTVMVTATPDEGYLFTGWTGDVPEGAAGDAAVTLLMDRTKNIHATFAADHPNVEPAPDPVAPGEILGGGAVTSEDRRTATCTDAEGNKSILSARDVTALTPGTSITLTAVPAEGKRLLYWKVSLGTLEGDSFSVEGDSEKIAANPLETVARAGVSYLAVFGDKLPNEGPELGVLELLTPEGRQLVSTDAEQNAHFGLQQDVYDYAVYLLPDETQAQVTLSTNWLEAPTDNSKLVSGITVIGDGEAAVNLIPQKGESQVARDWVEEDGTPLTLTLAGDKGSGTVTITLKNSLEETSDYTVTLIRVGEPPAVVISQQGAAIMATVKNVRANTISLALQLKNMGGFTEESLVTVIDESLLGSGYVRASKGGGTGGIFWQDGQLKLVLQREETVPAVPVSFTVKLFEGALGDVSLGDTRDNSIHDVRFGTLYSTTQIDGQISVKGIITAYNPKTAVTVQIWQGETPLMDQTPVAAAQSGEGAYTSDFTISLPAPGIYKLVLRKEGHISYTVLLDTNLHSTIPELYLACGDVDGDGRIDFEDKFRLTSAGYGSAVNPDDLYPRDLNGDGFVDARDLNLLTGKKHYSASEQSQWLDLRGGQGV